MTTKIMCEYKLALSIDTKSITTFLEGRRTTKTTLTRLVPNQYKTYSFSFFNGGPLRVGEGGDL